MSLGDDTPPDRFSDHYDQLRHDLKTPLTTIHARAQLVGRMVRRSSAMTEVERGAMLDSLGIIEAAVRSMVPLIDGMGGQSSENRGDGERSSGQDSPRGETDR